MVESFTCQIGRSDRPRSGWHCTFVGSVNNLDASDNEEGEMCEFSRKRDRSIEEA